MGDIIHAMPAIASLRDAFPNTSIGWLVEERWADLLAAAQSAISGKPLADTIHIVDTKKWRKSLLSPPTRKELGISVRELREMNYEVAIDLQGLIRSAVAARLSGAKRIYGFGEPREKAARLAYTNRVKPGGKHIVDQNVSLAEAFTGHKLTAAPIHFVRDEAIEQSCSFWLQEHGIDRFVLVNPGAGWVSKQWPTERYAELANELARLGFKSLINAGPGERGLALSIKSVSNEAAEIIECSIPQLIAFTRRASLFVGGDTGPMHLAAALRIPVVAIFGPTDPARNGPYGTRSIVLRSASSATNHSQRMQLDPGLLDISCEQVTKACRELLGVSRD